MRRFVAWMVSAVLVVEILGVSAASARIVPESSIGSRGAGDPYFPRDGNGGFSVGHYDLSMRYWPRSDRLDGTATITARSGKALSRFNLDFMLRVSSVLVNGRAAAYRMSGRHEVVVTPKDAIPARSTMQVVVTYSGFPGRVLNRFGNSWWRSTKDWTFVNGEPHAAAVWFPLSDHPSDKATYDIRATVPQPWKAVSAGELVGHRVSGGTSTWHWRVTEPMASYLTFLGLGSYTLARGTVDGRTYTYAWSSFFSQRTQDTIRTALGRTPELVDWLSARLGPYPFSHIGGTAPGGFAVATIESQTAPVYGHYLFARPDLIKITMVHELAHQWFGDSVSIRRWRDLWLNEGFATYLEWWWRAGHGGSSLNAQLLASYRATPREDPWWTIEPGDPGPGDKLFTSVYARGAMTLQALSNVVGAADLHRIIRTWTSQHRYGHGTTAEFIALAQRLSGKDLARFFRVWLYTPRRPAHTVANGFPAGAP